ncbi:MBL fold metallo-hydrolase [Halomicrococcus sp. SG-WS-1]|uniref:MBL fold metallo-hydrolase n=1 Tax=Halomicrococcus sp. SG-WS-1 TaxID=3439057 RepID=UPI003F78B750
MSEASIEKEDSPLVKTGNAELEYELGEDTPFVVIPRGGAQEVGRSCYQIETTHGTYLVDAGLNQGDGGLFPDFRGIEDGDIDAVFLTHAHIDHIGALPVLESHNLLAKQARIITTRPTEALADTLLHDSLKIHKEKAQEPGYNQLYDAKDVRAVLDRFVPRGYIQDDIQNYVPHVGQQEPLSFQFGNASHLLGSAWLALSHSGTRVVFSGDLGGRSNHLPSIDQPPTAEKLFLESTYGDTHSHRSASDTRTAIYNAAVEAALDGRPVLIPSFGVGRSQELLYMFKHRLHQLADDKLAQLRVYYDGMAVGATDTYNQHADGEFAAESIRRYRVNSGDNQPFLFGQAFAGYDIDRENIFTRDQTPIIIAPSGMLSGGFAPSYLVEFAERYDEAEVFLCGYQAEGTPGHVIEEGLTSDAEEVTVTLPANGIGKGIPDDEGTTVTLPTEWITRYHGLSAHAARNKLLEFARNVSPDEITLIHGESEQQKKLAEHLAENVSSVSGVRLAGMMHPTPIRPAANLEDLRFQDRPATKILDESGVEIDVSSENEARDVNDLHGDLSDVVERIEELESAFRTLDAQVALSRQEDEFSEQDIRGIVRDEVGEILQEEARSIVEEEFDNLPSS